MLGLGWLGGAAMLAALEHWGGAVTALLLVAMLVMLGLAWRGTRTREGTA
jgi:hypothetical protein